MTISSLVKDLDAKITQGKINTSLGLIHGFVERIITEPLCTSQVFGSKALDDLCQRIGKRSLSTINNKRTASTPEHQGQAVIVYIVTKLTQSGGHTRVIENFILARPDARHIILSTELTGRSETSYLIDSLGKRVCLTLELAPRDNYQQRLLWLQKRLLGIEAKKVYLFNHHQDSVAVAAIVPELEIDASFYHHGDHHLCLGVHLSHVEHIDPHPMGYNNCRDTLGINSIYIPLAIDDKGERPLHWRFLHDGNLITCTAAKSNKLEIPYFISYLEVIPKLLRATKGRHIHLGRLTPWALFNIYRRLKQYGIQTGRFIYKPWVPSVWKALHEYRVDLYIASFPYGGGVTLIEVMGAGVPVALHRHIFSRILSGIDLAYKGCFVWQEPEELLSFCSSVTQDYLHCTSQKARKHYEKYHRQEMLKVILSEEGYLVEKPQESEEKFLTKNDEFACWLENYLSWKNLIYRAGYRLFRRFRRNFF